MNAAHTHLLVNHLPVFGFLLGTVILLISPWKRLGEGGRTAALLLLIIAALGSFISVISGEEAAEMIFGVNGISEANIHEHEELAESANVIAIITGLAALALLILMLRNMKIAAWMQIIVLLLALATSITMILTGSSGGHIRHPEISRNWTIDSPSQVATDSTQYYEEHEEDH